MLFSFVFSTYAALPFGTKVKDSGPDTFSTEAPSQVVEMCLWKCIFIVPMSTACAPVWGTIFYQFADARFTIWVQSVLEFALGELIFKSFHHTWTVTFALGSISVLDFNPQAVCHFATQMLQ